VANIKRANASGITKSGTAISDVPDAPTIGAVSDLGTGSTASVAYTAATTGGAATTFTATSSPSGLTGTGSSPIPDSGLAESTAYTFTVTASNSTGSATSSASSSLTLTPVGKYESIASVTPSGVSTITFSSIPSTYVSLQVRAIGKRDTATTGGSANLRFNGDTGSNYAKHQLRGNGSTVTASGSASQSQIECFEYSGSDASVANMMGVLICDIHDYASTTKNKTVRVLNGVDFNGSGSVYLFSGLWMNTAAITSLTFYTSANYLNTTFALYGIKGA